MTRMEKYRLTSLMNTDAKVLNKRLVSHIQQYKKIVINHEHVGLIPSVQCWFNI